VLVVVLSALWGPPTDPQRLAVFYLRVRPPGWWRRTAATAGEVPTAPLAELKRRLVRVVACAISTYAWLIGLTEVLLGTQPLWRSAVVLALGCVVVPWWRRGPPRADA
jgi:hypothetical protein